MKSDIKEQIGDLTANSPQLSNWFSKLIWEQEFFQTLINNIPVAILLLNDQQKVVYSNQASKKYFDLETMRLKNSVINIFRATKFKELKIALKTLLNDENNLDLVEFNLLTKETRDMLVRIFPFKAEVSELFPWLKSGNLKVVVVLDITRWKDQSLKKNQEKSINSLHILTAGIAHEIKNPLGALDLHIQLIKRFLNKNQIEKKDELEELVQIVNEEINRLEAIVNDFLFSFRPSQPRKTPLNLNKIIEETAQFLKPKLDEKKINLRLQLDKDLGYFLFDKSQIKQMLINMLDNSIEAILEDKEQFDGGLIEIKTTELKEKIVLTISDNGVGIKNKNAIEIFQPFYTSKEMGTGLGLSIVTKIINEHDGEMILNQNVKEGMEFIIEFQRIKSKANLLSGKVEEV